MRCVLFSFQWRRKERGLFYALKQENVLGKKQFFGQAEGGITPPNQLSFFDFVEQKAYLAKSVGVLSPHTPMNG
jgi:hypothetical protein